MLLVRVRLVLEELVLLLELVVVEAERRVRVLEVQFRENKYCFFFFEPVEPELARNSKTPDARQKLKLAELLHQLLQTE